MNTTPIIRIAIAEDHDLCRIGYRNILLQKDNFRIILEAKDGKELLEGMKDEQPDVILLDLQMKIMNGKEAFEQIRLFYPSIRVIIISAFYSDEHIRYYFTKGASGYLSKNIDVDNIYLAIEKVMSAGFLL